MQYNGGKKKVARELAAVIGMFQPRVYWEPFVGAGNVIQEVKAPIRIGSDLDIHIISYLRLIQSGWTPPNLTITPEIYQFWRSYQPCSKEEFAVKAVIGYGCSFGGKWFGGLARVPRKDSKNSFYQTAQIAGKRRVIELNGIQFFQQPFYQMTPEGVNVIYCDPPYQGTANCGSSRKFNHDFFWSWCKACALTGITVLVTEFNAPDFALEVWRKTKASDLRKNDGSLLTEKLFLVQP